jgi:hypothetical protein
MTHLMRPILSLALMLSAMPAMAQDRHSNARESAPVQQAPLPQTRQGETAQSAAGQAGQRQSRERVAANSGIKPMGRINGRIQNRVQARIRNRIDRYYDPRANATSPFAVASEQAAAAGRAPR